MKIGLMVVVYTLAEGMDLKAMKIFDSKHQKFFNFLHEYKTSFLEVQLQQRQCG